MDVSANQAWMKELNAPFALSDAERSFYTENGYIKLRQVLPAKLLEHYRVHISAKVAELSAVKLPLDQRSTYDKAFLQVGNLWLVSAEVREFVFGRRLARIAAELMGCRGVRLYHDQALYKEPGGGITPWHADQYYFPVSNDHVVTAWVPLQDTPLEMGPLAFCEKSHRLHYGRDLEIGDESEAALEAALKEFTKNNNPYSLGDVSFHAGWTFHRAEANSSKKPREVMTMIYIDQEMRLAAPKNKNQILDREEYCPLVPIGEIIDSPLTPVIYSRE
jgi:ectoine hydroxylase-related dioxygenase (phytanoyl-CoA dioxygenase family)